jgi:hypothetical protein
MQNQQAKPALLLWPIARKMERYTLEIQMKALA